MAWTEAARQKAKETKLKSGIFNQYDKAHANGESLESPLKGKHTKGKPHTEEAKQKIKEKALASKHRRLLKSTRIYVKKDGSQVLLDSSWEEALASRLDQLEIKWERPTEPIIWVDSVGRNRNYLPDFYLIDSKLYIDPKNHAALVSQKEKVDWLLENRKDVKFLYSLKECTEFCP